MSLDIHLTQPQADFLALQCKFPLFVAGYGSGKTFTLTTSALVDSMSFGGARIGVYSDTFDQLRLNIVPRLEEMFEDAAVPHKFNNSTFSLTFMLDGKENSIVCRSIDNPKRIIGYETFRAHVDEIEAASNEAKATEVWQKIAARNRQRHPDYRDGMKVIPFHMTNRVSAYTTPDQGFGFTYKRWGKGHREGYGHVQASTMSNPHLPSDYVDALRNDYPEELVEAYLYGSWCNLTAGTVYTAFDRDSCNSDREIMDGEPLHIGMDFNVNAMAATIFVQDGHRTVAASEIFGCRDTAHMIDTIKDKFPNHHITVYPDSSGGSGSTSGGASTSDITLLIAAGFAVRAEASNPRVRNRVVCVNSRLADGTVRVNVARCPQLVEGLERQAYDRNGAPDKTQGFDHMNDAFGYRICYSYPLRAQQNRVIHAR